MEVIFDNSSPPLVGVFNIWGKVRAGTRTQDLTHVNRANQNHARDVILLVVESINN